MLREMKIECAREGQGGHFLITIRLIQRKLDRESRVATFSLLLVSQRKVYSERFTALERSRVAPSLSLLDLYTEAWN